LLPAHRRARRPRQPARRPAVRRARPADPAPVAAVAVVTAAAAATARPARRAWALARRAARPFVGQPAAVAGLMVLLAFLAVGLLAPRIAPYNPLEKQYTESGRLKRLLPPSREHLLGTTLYGRDVLSQVVMGTRTALF